MTRSERTARFRAMHQERRAFVMPNPWDSGSARIFAHMGFEALATTSAGLACSLGRLDATVTLDEALEHAARIVADAPALPVSADFENGFADDPAGVAETVRLAAEAGLAGVSIEDVRGGEAYPHETAVERIAAAMEAARSADIVLCARADGVMEECYDVEEAYRRLEAFAALGVDCVYAPFLPDLATIERFADGLSAPLNVLMGFGPSVTVEELKAARVGRISLGSALSSTAYGAAHDAALEIIQTGGFSLAEEGGRKNEFNAALQS